MNIFGFEMVDYTVGLASGFYYGVIVGFFFGLMRFILFTGAERHEA